MNLIDMVRETLDFALNDPKVVLLSQLGKYGLGGMTTGLYDRHPDQVLTFPVCENLMNGTAFGLALAGHRPIVIHERMDFLAVGMDPLVNHIPIWPMRSPQPLPLVIIAVVGKGHGQGPQHSKNLTSWFRGLQGWDVIEPDSPARACGELTGAINGNRPTLCTLHREFFAATDRYVLPATFGVRICGASDRHEKAFYP